jgi:hypothetical protein
MNLGLQTFVNLLRPIFPRELTAIDFNLDAVIQYSFGFGGPISALLKLS